MVAHVVSESNALSPPPVLIEGQLRLTLNSLRSWWLKSHSSSPASDSWVFQVLALSVLACAVWGVKGSSEITHCLLPYILDFEFRNSFCCQTFFCKPAISYIWEEIQILRRWSCVKQTVFPREQYKVPLILSEGNSVFNAFIFSAQKSGCLNTLPCHDCLSSWRVISDLRHPGRPAHPLRPWKDRRGESGAGVLGLALAELFLAD